VLSSPAAPLLLMLVLAIAGGKAPHAAAPCGAAGEHDLAAQRWGDDRSLLAMNKRASRSGAGSGLAGAGAGLRRGSCCKMYLSLETARCCCLRSLAAAQTGAGEGLTGSWPRSIDECDTSKKARVGGEGPEQVQTQIFSSITFFTLSLDASVCFYVNCTNQSRRRQLGGLPANPPTRRLRGHSRPHLSTGWQSMCSQLAGLSTSSRRGEEGRGASGARGSCGS
jgi:hypothetical protein